MITLPLEQMSRAEKLMAMEALWENLTRDDKGFESPSWHREELAITEERVRSGKEQSIDWDAAKQELRRRSK